MSVLNGMNAKGRLCFAAIFLFGEFAYAASAVISKLRFLCVSFSPFSIESNIHKTGSYRFKFQSKNLHNLAPSAQSVCLLLGGDDDLWELLTQNIRNGNTKSLQNSSFMCIKVSVSLSS